jgi:hypothetical protein
MNIIEIILLEVMSCLLFAVVLFVKWLIFDMRD